MGKSAEHRAKAESHLAFLATVADEFPDWLCTVAFYAAVEFVEEMLAARGHHSKSHFERKEALRKAFPKSRVIHAFSTLYNASLDARYLQQAHCPTAREARDILINVHLTTIRQFADAQAAKRGPAQ